MLRQLSVSTPTRSQSELIGYVLLISLTIVSTGALIAFGGEAITQLNNDLENERAETTLKAFDSEASAVASGGATGRTIEFPQQGDSSYQFDSTAGSINITATNVTTGSTTVLHRTQLGAITFEEAGRELAYQGGGVWSATDAGGSMISPPDITYRSGTLTLPLTTLDGKDGQQISGRTELRRSNHEVIFPSETGPGASFSNPIRANNVTLTIQSDYYRGWAVYLETRTRSDVDVFDHNNTVSATLVPPPTPIKADSAIVASGDLTLKGSSQIDGDVTLGGTVDDETKVIGTVIENQPAQTELTDATADIAKAESRLSGTTAPTTAPDLTAGTYYFSDDEPFDSGSPGPVTFDTSDGDIEVFVDGDVDAKVETVVKGDNDVSIYVDGEYKMKGQTEWGTEGKEPQLFLYSTGLDRVTSFYGVIKTDAVDIAGLGSKDGLTGALISTADTVELSGNSNIEYAGTLSNVVLDEATSLAATVQYLHLTERAVTVDS